MVWLEIGAQRHATRMQGGFDLQQAARVREGKATHMASQAGATVEARQALVLSGGKLAPSPGLRVKMMRLLSS